MCSACITSSPAGVEERGRAVVALLDVGRVGGADQRRAHLVAGGAQAADQDLEGDRVEPAHRAVPFPRISCAWNRARIVPVASTFACQPGGRIRVASGSSKTTGPSRRGAGSGLAAQHRGLDPLAVEQHRPGALLKPAARCGRGVQLRPGHDHRQADVDEDDLAVGIAMAVALLVGAFEALAKVGRIGIDGAGDRQLEGLAGVPHLVDDLRPGLGQAGAGGGDQLGDLGRDALGAQLGPAQHHRASGVATALGGAEAERREDAAGARAEDRLDPQLGGDRRRVHRAGAAEGEQGEAARVDRRARP